MIIFNIIKNLLLFKYKFISSIFYIIFLFILYIFLLVKMSGDSDYNIVLENDYINDVTRLNSILVDKIIKPTNISQIKNAIKNTSGPISIGGGKYSMGGQTAFENSLHIDMRDFNKVINLNTDKKQVTVQAGITWRDLQDVIDKANLSIKIMQTYANFTVGGSVSVNCHGRYIGHGPIISSIESLKIILASGEIVTANRRENSDIFNAAIGGYGGIGIILEVTLYLENNTKVKRHTEIVDVNDYNTFFKNNIENNKNVIFQNADLYGPDYNKLRNVSFINTEEEVTNENRITKRNKNYILEQNAVQFVAYSDFGKWIKVNIIDPLYYSFDKIVWRNKEASYDVLELEPYSREKTTYVLNEYFIPVNNFKEFIPKMRKIYEKYDVNIVNISIRHAKKDLESYLNWAKNDVFAFVVYYKQGTSDKEKKIVKSWTKEITNAILEVNGTWYLPYQPHATFEQFKEAYPKYQEYFKIKEKYDPKFRFTNKLLDKYNPNRKIIQSKKLINNFKKKEEQTVLTVPEWYLVFNPKEYANYLISGNNPSNFPFYKSIDEYWKLYDRSLILTSKYPRNNEYMSMLNVIGLSITIEYGIKILYENTIGKFFSFFSNDNISSKEEEITNAHIAYSDFIYNTAFYEFKFFPWVKKVWKEEEYNKGYSSIRKWERVIFFTLEFSFKALYSSLIEIATKATYDEPNKNIYLELLSKNIIKEQNDLKIIKNINDNYIISIPRWGKFTNQLISLSKQDITIKNIAGNKRIVISLITNVNKNINFKNVKYLYHSDVVTDLKLKRLVYMVEVKDLINFMKYLENQNIKVEHIYDY